MAVILTATDIYDLHRPSECEWRVFLKGVTLRVPERGAVAAQADQELQRLPQ